MTRKDQYGDLLPRDLVVLIPLPQGLTVEDAILIQELAWYEVEGVQGIILVSERACPNSDIYTIPVRLWDSGGLRDRFLTGPIHKISPSLIRFNWTDGFYHT